MDDSSTNIDIDWNDDDDSLDQYTSEIEANNQLLNNSLLALSSHLAQVQLRLGQIVQTNDINEKEKEQMLIDLNAFANRGIPDLMVSMNPIEQSNKVHAEEEEEEEKEDDDNNDDDDDDDSVSERTTRTKRLSCSEDIVEQQRIRQRELIAEVRKQLHELEQYAYESGECDSVPSATLIERQNLVIEQIRSKLPALTIDGIDQCSSDELRNKVDHAVRELLNPVIMTDQLVEQLRTQITDLERYINFIQKGDESVGKRSKMLRLKSLFKLPIGLDKESLKKSKQINHKQNEVITSQSSSQVLCKRSEISSNLGRINSMIDDLFMQPINVYSNYRKTHPGFVPNKCKIDICHWGDVRAQLEFAIDSILSLSRERNSNDSDYTSEADEITSNNIKLACSSNGHEFNQRMYTLVRNKLIPALRDLLQHGMVGCNQSNKNHHNRVEIEPFENSQSNTTRLLSFALGCFSISSNSRIKSTEDRPWHAWHILRRYYDLKFSGTFKQSSSSFMLNQSFNLCSQQQQQQSTTISNKHDLMITIDNIICSHKRRTLDSHFKTFICIALNEQTLARWLRIVLVVPSILNDFYEPWSYVASTGFNDALQRLDKLNNVRFNLPTDRMSRRLNDENEAF